MAVVVEPAMIVSAAVKKYRNDQPLLQVVAYRSPARANYSVDRSRPQMPLIRYSDSTLKVISTAA